MTDKRFSWSYALSKSNGWLATSLAACRTLVGRAANPSVRSTIRRFLAHGTTMGRRTVENLSSHSRILASTTKVRQAASFQSGIVPVPADAIALIRFGSVPHDVTRARAAGANGGYHAARVPHGMQFSEFFQWKGDM